jgi:hypothetical protein
MTLTSAATIVIIIYTWSTVPSPSRSHSRLAEADRVIYTPWLVYFLGDCYSRTYAGAGGNGCTAGVGSRHSEGSCSSQRLQSIGSWALSTSRTCDAFGSRTYILTENP